LENAGLGAFLSHLTIIGGGWAGLAAAVRATEHGFTVRLLEAAPQLGGRARRVMHDGLALDNGQHIFIGAYRDTLHLMRTIGVDSQNALWRMPLQLQTIDGEGLALPRLPAPLNLLIGVGMAKGWSWGDKFTLLRVAAQWQRQGFRCQAQMNVAQLCRNIPSQVMNSLIEPLCVSALNLPPHLASGQVFLTVLKDALWSGQGGSDLLLPRVDLGQLMPDAALAWLSHRGAVVQTHQRVQTLEPWLNAPVVLACPPWEAALLTQTMAPEWSAMASALAHTAISTVYVRTQQALNWPSPMVAMTSSDQAPAQFAFDKGRLSTEPQLEGVLALVASASLGERNAITADVMRQLPDQLGIFDAALITTVVEKRATFACVPALERPPLQVCEGVVACGDYVAGPYPATIEAAVRSGFAAVDALKQPA
jgi:squalene-associated FAD-dependent desaturase